MLTKKRKILLALNFLYKKLYPIKTNKKNIQKGYSVNIIGCSAECKKGELTHFKN